MYWALLGESRVLAALNRSQNTEYIRQIHYYYLNEVCFYYLFLTIYFILLSFNNNYFIEIYCKYSLNTLGFFVPIW